jgi:hypothetical protein
MEARWCFQSAARPLRRAFSTAADVGKVMTVTVAYTDGEGFPESVTSAGTVGGRRE